jgi:hypothetical protein
MRKLRYLTEDEEKEVFNERENGLSRKDSLNKWGISSRHYKDIVLKFGGEMNKFGGGKYGFNEDYFEKIDTEDKAYFLGFIVADGCISDKTNKITIIQKETDILYEFKRYINSEGNIFTSKSRNISSFGISSIKTKKDLENLGIHSNKTMVVKYPNISENLQNHFMRGVFDGDGCISLRTDKRDNSQRGQVNICSGSYDFIKEYYDRLVEYCGLSGKNKIRNPKGSYYVVDWGGLSDIEKIYEFLYKDSNVYLKRKRETFDKVVSITKVKNKYRK